jgi:hypothetical protein
VLIAPALCFFTRRIEACTRSYFSKSKNASVLGSYFFQGMAYENNEFSPTGVAAAPGTSHRNYLLKEQAS